MELWQVLYLWNNNPRHLDMLWASCGRAAWQKMT